MNNKDFFWNAHVVNTLDTCIEKMSENLNRNFNPEDLDSCRLFKLFCSALNTRRRWMKTSILNEIPSPEEWSREIPAANQTTQPKPENSDSFKDTQPNTPAGTQNNNPSPPQDTQPGQDLKR